RGLTNELTPVDVVAGGTHSGVNFGLSSGGSITGTVTGDAGAGLGSVNVAAYSAVTGRIVKQTATDFLGNYTMTRLQAGTYYLSTAGPPFQPPFYMDELYDNFPCLGCIGGAYPAVVLACQPACVPSVATSTPVAVTNGATHSGVNFSLASGAGVIS